MNNYHICLAVLFFYVVGFVFVLRKISKVSGDKREKESKLDKFAMGEVAEDEMINDIILESQRSFLKNSIEKCIDDMNKAYIFCGNSVTQGESVTWRKITSSDYESECQNYFITTSMPGHKGKALLYYKDGRKNRNIEFKDIKSAKMFAKKHKEKYELKGERNMDREVKSVVLGNGTKTTVVVKKSEPKGNIINIMDLEPCQAGIVVESSDRGDVGHLALRTTNDCCGTIEIMDMSNFCILNSWISDSNENRYGTVKVRPVNIKITIEIEE